MHAVAKRAWAPLAVTAIAALVLFVGWPCPIRALFGVPCPTCGVTRATRLALSGDLGGAWRMHPLFAIAVPFAASAIAIEIVGYVREGRWGRVARLRGSKAALAVVATLPFGVWIARFAGAFGGPVPP